MKREILFRGLRTDGKGWMYGNLLNEQTIGEVGGNLSHYKYATVIPESVGQFTGLTDKNGTKIFEGDKLRLVMNLTAGKPITKELEVYFYKGSFCVDWDFKGSFNHLSDFSNSVTFEVIGNIHEGK